MIYLTNDNLSLKVIKLLRIYDTTIDEIYPTTNATFTLAIRHEKAHDIQMPFMVLMTPITKNLKNSPERNIDFNLRLLLSS